VQSVEQKNNAGEHKRRKRGAEGCVFEKLKLILFYSLFLEINQWFTPFNHSDGGEFGSLHYLLGLNQLKPGLTFSWALLKSGLKLVFNYLSNS
jgi:hypothetical protein